MKRGTDPSRGESSLPSDAQPCVWMTAGLVAWKLCDRGFDCEHCPLDEALRGKGAPPECAPLPEPTLHLDFPEDRRYHRLHGWAADAGGGRVRVGFDAFAAHLLDRMTSVVLPAPETRVERGRTACWVADDAELLPLCAPASGRVCATNHLVQEHPGLVASFPYDRGWLYEVEAPEPGLPEDTLSAGQIRSRSEMQMRQLHRRVCASLAPDARVGVTMADGGVRLHDLRRVLGVGRYHRLILAFLR